MNLSRGTALLLLGVGLFAATMAVSAATAPDRNIGGAGTPDPSTPVPGDGPPTATDPDSTATPTETPLPARPQTLVGVQGGWVRHGYVFGLDGHDVAWSDDRADSYFEVSQLANGTVAAAFANESSTDCGPDMSSCGRTGFRVVDPDDGRVLSEYSFPVQSLTNSEVHAVDSLGDGRFVFTDMDEERVVVVENGTAVWEWRASSFYDAPSDPTSRDWLHINDVDAIGDGRFLVSVRNANQLVVLERGEGVVEVINEDRGGGDAACTSDGQLDDFDGDGEVRCGDPDVIDHQHNPQWLGDGAVLVADSDNDRAVELHRDDEGVWEPQWVVREVGGIELDWPRDADRLPNGNTLVTDTNNKRVVEVAPDGDAVWSVAVDPLVARGSGLPYEADRLPFGELAGGSDASATPSTGTDADTATPADRSTPLPQLTGTGDANDTGSDVPGLSLAVAGLQGTFSWIPFWFGELHLGVTILSLGLVVGGVGDHVWRRYRDGDLSNPFR